MAESLKYLHGETYCEHCKAMVVLCSHGMGIDYAELLKREEKKYKRAIELIKHAKAIGCFTSGGSTEGWAKEIIADSEL